MDALRWIVELVLREAVESLSAGPPAAPMRVFDPYALATRPLPADLRLFPHPKEISTERVRRITNGVRI